jgi:hypothetical protein
LAIFLGYLNILVCGGLFLYGQRLLVMRPYTYADPYTPFRVARVGMAGLLVGMFLFGLRLWLKKNRPVRRHGRIIFFVSLAGLAVGFLLFA